ncbi:MULTISPECIES: hypothetical protein [Vreelandella]|uniref:Uncharacterized protein n=2 Tax=Vreelandella TaxID=3137766 RepID=A0A7C9KUV3_9GAMM|nr:MULTISPECIES: hypothetical protein [Halomonas]NDL69577.1 hypothetical protein [Halomonas alkaliphila]NYS43518.1 hypothetical protein [Halomonas zhaodongensis]
MLNRRLWIPALASAALLLSACGDSQEEATVPAEDSAPSVSDDDVIQNDEAPAAAENAADMPSPEEIEDDVEARQAAEQLDEAEALRSEEEADTDALPVSGEDVQAGDDTLAADPEDALDEASAMPGETTRSDVDDVIAETERRFEEAQRRLDEQFQEVEQQAPVLEPMESEEFSTDWETDSSLPDSPRLEDDLEAADVDALIEDTERRFEEAQQRLEQQFEEIEQGRSVDGELNNNRTETE